MLGGLKDRSHSVKVAALFHDLGKIRTTKWDESKGWFTAHGHERESLLMWEESKHRFRQADPETVEFIIANHHRARTVRKQKKVQELHSHKAWGDLVAFMQADDMLAVTNLEKRMTDGRELLLETMEVGVPEGFWFSFKEK